ncbi:hypothetical protein D3C74_329240 [compost metagenome]
MELGLKLFHLYHPPDIGQLFIFAKQLIQAVKHNVILLRQGLELITRVYLYIREQIALLKLIDRMQQFVDGERVSGRHFTSQKMNDHP